jgi:hypothetical protein
VSAGEQFGGKNSSRLSSLNPEAAKQEAGTRQAEEANSSGQDGQQVVFHAWVCRLNLMTFGTGHSWTHRAQAVQASALTTYACLLRWTHALNRSPSDRSRLSAAVKERISRTEYGQAGTQGHLASAQAWWYPPSHLVRSIIGTKSPGFCSFLIWLTLFHLGHERQRVACLTSIVARNHGRVHSSALPVDAWHTQLARRSDGSRRGAQRMVLSRVTGGKWKGPISGPGCIPRRPGAGSRLMPIKLCRSRRRDWCKIGTPTRRRACIITPLTQDFAKPFRVIQCAADHGTGPPACRCRGWRQLGWEAR